MEPQVIEPILYESFDGFIIKFGKVAQFVCLHEDLNKFQTPCQSPFQTQENMVPAIWFGRFSCQGVALASMIYFNSLGHQDGVYFNSQGKRPCHRYNAIGIQFRSEDPSSEDQLHLQSVYSTQVVSQTIDGFHTSCGGHNNQCSYCTFQSIQHRSLGRSSLPQSILRDFHGCDEVGHWYRAFPKYESVIQMKLAYVPLLPRVLKVCNNFRENGYLSTKYPYCWLVRKLGLTHVFFQV